MACAALQVLQVRDGSVSIKELSDLTAIKTDDIISTLQHLNLIQYQKGQHVICAAPSVIDRTLKAAGSPGLEVHFLSFPSLGGELQVVLNSMPSYEVGIK